MKTARNYFTILKLVCARVPVYVGMRRPVLSIYLGRLVFIFNRPDRYQSTRVNNNSTICFSIIHRAVSL